MKCNELLALSCIHQWPIYYSSVYFTARDPYGGSCFKYRSYVFALPDGGWRLLEFLGQNDVVTSHLGFGPLAKNAGIFGRDMGATLFFIKGQ